VYLFIYSLVVLGFEVRTSHLLGWCLPLEPATLQAAAIYYKELAHLILRAGRSTLALCLVGSGIRKITGANEAHVRLQENSLPLGEGDGFVLFGLN
jgi:hypothetical protein